MSLVNMKRLLAQAAAQSRAVGAFNVCSMETVLGVVRAAEEMDTPVILEIAQQRMHAAPLEAIGPIMLGAAKRARVDVAVHLDHTSDIGVIRAALDLGFTSVMFDGSRLPLEQNIERTREVAGLAHSRGAAAEGEIGVVGGGEDGSEIAMRYTDPQTAAVFARETGVDALAIAIGNAHGLYKQPARLRMDIVRAVGERTDTPLVLHGGTGLTDADYRACIQAGMRKINIATAVAMCAARAAQGCSDAYEMGERVAKEVKQLACRYIQLFGVEQKEAEA